MCVCVCDLLVGPLWRRLYKMSMKRYNLIRFGKVLENHLLAELDFGLIEGGCGRLCEVSFVFHLHCPFPFFAVLFQFVQNALSHLV